MVELLSPAGNFISLRAVLENGADATYFGLDDFNMRANAKNFSLNDLSEVSKIAKQYSAKTYLCSNVILNEDRAVELKNNLELYKEKMTKYTYTFEKENDKYLLVSYKYKR